MMILLRFSMLGEDIEDINNVKRHYVYIFVCKGEDILEHIDVKCSLCTL